MVYGVWQLEVKIFSLNYVNAFEDWINFAQLNGLLRILLDILKQ